MEGILVSGGGCVGMIVSPDRPVEYFEHLGILGLDCQRVNLGPGPVEKGVVWLDVGGEVVPAVLVDDLEAVPAA